MLTPEDWTIVALSLKISLVAMAVTLPIAFALAYLLARGRFRGKALLDAAIHLPLVLPPVVIGWLLLLAFGANGPVGGWLARVGISVMFRWTGAAIAAGVMALPLIVRAIRLSIEGVDRRLEGAARTLGAGPWRTFATVTLPLCRPGVLAGLVLGFARAIGEFGATITFVSNIPGETRTLPIAIYSALQMPGGDAAVVKLASVSVALSLAALLLSEWLARRQAGPCRMAFDVDVGVRRGEARIGTRFAVGEGLTVLFGPSGAGKTSVLDMIAGLVRPDRGHVRIGGVALFDAAAGIDLRPEARRIGYVFQDARLFPHMKVRENLLYGHRLASPDARWIDLDTVTAFLGIGDLLARWPRTLSGGEAQRVAIGRALLSGARCLLMDEPLASLDAARRTGIMTVIARIRDELRLPILYVTHDAAEADRLATHRIAIERG